MLRNFKVIFMYIFFRGGSPHYVALDGLKLEITCFCLLSPGIKA